MISYEQYLQFSPYFAQEDIEKEKDRLKFFESFDVLPQTVKNLIASVDIAEKIMAIGKTFGLDEFDTEAISLAVRKIAAGEIFIGNGADFIAKETELPLEKAQNLLDSIVSGIFSPAMGEIKNIQKESFPDRQSPIATSTQSTSRISDKPGLKIDPRINKNNIVDLRNRQN